MNFFFKDQPTFQEALSQYHSGQSIRVHGLWDSSQAAWISEWFFSSARSLLAVTAGTQEAERLYQDIVFFLNRLGIKQKPLFFPAWEILPDEEAEPSIEIVAERFQTLMGLKDSNSHLVVCPIGALVHKMVDPSSLNEWMRDLAKGSSMRFSSLLEFLEMTGYSRNRVVEAKGDYAVRGALVDIFSPQWADPIRIEFNGDEISSLRFFSPQTQVSIQYVDCARIIPVCEKKLTGVSGSVPVLRYFAGFTDWVYSQSDDIDRWIGSHRDDLLVDVSDELEILHNTDSHKIYLSDLASGSSLARPTRGNGLAPESEEYPGSDPMGGTFSYSIQRTSAWQYCERAADFRYGLQSGIFQTVDEKIKEGYQFIFVSPREAEAARLKEILQERKSWDPKKLSMEAGDLSSGFILADQKLALLTDHEIFGRVKMRSARVSSQVRGIEIQEVSDLKPGDWVVHLNYGVGRFLGIQVLKDKTSEGEFLTLEYDEGAKLYVPADQIELIEKYIGIHESKPKLNRLGGKDWPRSRIRTERSIRDFAAELLEVQAQRNSIKGSACGPDKAWQREFEDSFIFDETPDQRKAIDDVKRDLESSRPMDRLICGDVGFGKTEVAIRAIFKVVMEGKQAAVLVPTTVLAQQHYYNFRERFSGYPMEVDMLSRFRTDSEQKQTLLNVKEGRVDVLVGTHRLLGGDVEFKDLGLLVIDEEQRFGVAHKERIKKLRTCVDVLTLSATPIPRTLYMAMTQAKDMSVINTAPENRLPIETTITTYDDRLVRNAILRELARDGQVFYIHNRVMDIFHVRDRVQRLAGSARVSVAHGQMHESELEEVMENFIDGKIQVLISTNIVESGLDIPNANTMIVDHAENFGLADLYQLRGRVGRFHRKAYAYFLYSNDAVLNREAKLRLKTISDFTQLGAGFKVAMRDLEIRGAGNILGKEQHGHISAVGFSLYCRLLDDTIRRMKGEAQKLMNPVSVQLGFEMMIPHEFIADPVLRMEIYQKIFRVGDESEIEKIRSEILDRFGNVPDEIELLLELAVVKTLARVVRVTSIQRFKDRIYFRRGETICHREPVDSNSSGHLLMARLRKVLKAMEGCDNVKKYQAKKRTPK